MNMRTFDISPLYRASVGFDRLANVMDALGRTESATPSYPPYNIEKTGEDAYRISLAVAGFGPGDIDLEIHNGRLTISGGRKAAAKKEGRTFLYRGIAERAFERRFELDAHVKVAGAELENGLLHVDLVREVPEALKPRKIAIRGHQPAAVAA